MLKDKVVWVGCSLLFLSGALWGGNLKAEGFFNVASLHDLFDIFGAIATIVAVVLAAVGLNRWKVEVGAESDHELARRLSVVLLKYRLELQGLWNYADLASQHSASEAWMQGQDQFSNYVFESAISRMNTARSELESVGLECAAIWGGMYENCFEELFRFENVCVNTIQGYLFLCASRPVRDWFWTNSSASVKNWNEFNEGDFQSVEYRIKSIVDSIYLDIKNKLLRGFD